MPQLRMSSVLGAVSCALLGGACGAAGDPVGEIVEDREIPVGALYYVSPSGNDSGPGSSQQPYKTLGKATQVAKAGDTVIVRAGTYSETLAPANGGTAQAPVVFKAAPGEDVVIDGSTGKLTGWSLEGQNIWRIPWSGGAVHGVFQDTFATAGKHTSLWNMIYNVHGSNPNLDLHGFDPSHDWYGSHKKHDELSQFKQSGGWLRVRTLDGKSPDQHDVRAAVRSVGIAIAGKPYVTVEGFKVRYVKNFATVDDSPGARIVGCDFRYAGNTGIWITASDGAQLTNTVIQGSGSWIGHYADNVQVTKANGVKIEGNDFSYGGHSGLLFVKGSSSFVVRKNHFHDMGGSLLTIKQDANGGLVEDNVFEEAPYLAEVNVHKTAHAALQLSGEGHVFRRNVVHDCGYGLMISCSDVQVALDNEFHNNTLHTFEYDAIQLQGYQPAYAGNLDDNTFENNVVVGAGAHLVRLDLPGGEKGDFWGNRFRNNLWHAGTLRAWTSTVNVATAEASWPSVFQANLEADPKLVDVVADDYRLLPGSPAIDKGVNVGLPYSGAAPDIGAFELGAGGGSNGGGNGGGGNPPAGPAVVAFHVYNAVTDQLVASMSPLAPGATIDLSAVGTSKITLVALTAPATVGSVVFGLDGNASFRVENKPPYALAGDDLAAGDFYSWTPSPGTHTIKATPYASGGGTGAAGTPLEVTFQVVASSTGGACCSASGQPGCSSGSIQTCVCAVDPYCCATAWDSICVSEVPSLGCGSCN